MITTEAAPAASEAQIHFDDIVPIDQADQMLDEILLHIGKKSESLNNLIAKSLHSTYGNKKFIDPNETTHKAPTGKLLRLDECQSGICIIDFDIHGSEECSSIDVIREDIILQSLKDAAPLVDINKLHIKKTRSGGLHIYTKADQALIDLHSGRIVDCMQITDYGISVDLFISGKSSKANGVMFSGTAKKDPSDRKEKAGSYTTIYGDFDGPMLYSTTTILEAVGLLGDFQKMIATKIQKPAGSSIEATKDVEPAPTKLLDAIVAGFKAEHFTNQIHASYSISDDRPSIINIISGIISAAGSEDPMAMLDEIKQTAPLTSKARSNWDRLVDRQLSSQSRYGWRQLLHILSNNAKIYYETTLSKVASDVRTEEHHKAAEEEINNRQSRREQWRNDTYTTADFNMDMEQTGFNGDRDELLSALSRCIAFERSTGHIIARARDIKNRFTYNVCPHDAACELLNNFEFEYESGSNQKTRILCARTILRNSSMRNRFTSFDSVKIFTNNPDCLQLFTPPSGDIETDYDEGLVIKFINLMMDRIDPTYHQAFMEMLYSHAYRFRHPLEFVEKFFVLYGKNGGEGKSFLIGMLCNIYGDYGQDGLDMTKGDEKFNGWMFEKLMLNLNEIENDAYGSRLQKYVKEATTFEGSARGMMKETTKRQRLALCSMVTNDSKLSGLVRADDATKSRLVIIKFKDAQSMGYDEFSEKCAEISENKNFSFSLYTYLSAKMDIPSSFKKSRYNGKEKQSFINEQNFLHRSLVEEWLIDCVLTESTSIVRETVVGKETYKYILATEGRASYDSYKGGNRMVAQKIDQLMIDSGFKTISAISTTIRQRGFRIQADEFALLQQKYIPIEEEAVDETDDEASIKISALH
jgi:hypothetical protein